MTLSIHLPPALAEVQDTIYDFYKDQRIIPLSHKTKAATIRSPEARDILSLTLFKDTSKPQQYSPIPPVRSLRTANTKVYAYLLRLALQPDLKDVNSSLINFTVATTARTHHLLHNRGPSKMIDFAMYINTKVVQDTHLSQRIKELRQKFPSNAVNSTLYHFLRNKPISVTIKTKRSDGLKQAVLQIGIWQAAH
ncbi:Putative PD-(D/E)XK nuclease [Colletotrichum destructivum]|uniref:PD-(D/E)XK nuclease n=1 Tax=Colletotrichum destructivum TaxID=34406 RepID=A0AAX4J1D9_9PEZI|nr:Putative PD-(D/E)XK nuclease [Colletotrichum destructivum]